jgi:hypothetical protein
MLLKGTCHIYRLCSYCIQRSAVYVVGWKKACSEYGSMPRGSNFWVSSGKKDICQFHEEFPNFGTILQWFVFQRFKTVRSTRIYVVKLESVEAKFPKDGGNCQFGSSGCRSSQSSTAGKKDVEAPKFCWLFYYCRISV